MNQYISYKKIKTHSKSEKVAVSAFYNKEIKETRPFVKSVKDKSGRKEVKPFLVDRRCSLSR